MQKTDYDRKKLIITLSIALLFISVYLFATKELTKENPIGKLIIESVNIKNISTAKITNKDGRKKVIISDDSNAKKESNSQLVSVDEKTKDDAAQQLNATTLKWQLPTKRGNISQYPNFYHVALDITSPSGVYETIYPIYPGKVTGIYYDPAGAKIVTIHHFANGKNYTSQYVHLSSFANNLYVGKYLTENDPIGQMGRTGLATGVHLHLTVADCILFDPNDYNCKDLNSFFRYIKIRYNQGFKGLPDLTYVPSNW